MDIWAEAVKHILIQMKSSVTTELTAGTARKVTKIQNIVEFCKCVK